MNGALFFQLLRFLARQTFISGNTNCCFFLFSQLLLSFLPSLESKPRWFRPPLSILFHWSVSPSVTRGCCCHRTTFAFPVVRRRRSVKVLEVVARSNNHEQPELSFERASERARASASAPRAHVSPPSATCSQLNSRRPRPRPAPERACAGHTGRAPAAADTIELLLQRNFNVGSAAGRRRRPRLLFHRRRRRRHRRRQMSVLVLVVVHL